MAKVDMLTFLMLVDKAGVFETAVALEGGDAKQDVLFTASAIGAFEFEFQNDVADSLTGTY